MESEEFTTQDVAVERAEAYADENGWPKLALDPHRLGELTDPKDIAGTEWGPLG